MNRVLFVKMLVAAMISVNGVAFADPAKGGARSPDRADELFEQASTAFDAGRYSEAHAKLQVVWSMKQTYDVAGNLGVVEIKLGKYAAAAEHLSWALQHFPPTETTKARRGYEQELQTARAQVGVLRVRLNVDGATMTVNGVPVNASTIYVDPGTAIVEAKLTGYLGARQTVAIAKGGEQEVKLTLVPERHGPKPAIIITGSALTAVALGTGIALFAAASSKKSDAEGDRAPLAKIGSCPAASIAAECKDLRDKLDSASTMHNVSVGAFISAGIVGAATAGYAIVSSRRSAASDATAVQIAPIFDRAGGGISVGGTF